MILDLLQVQGREVQHGALPAGVPSQATLEEIYGRTNAASKILGERDLGHPGAVEQLCAGQRKVAQDEVVCPH